MNYIIHCIETRLYTSSEWTLSWLLIRGTCMIKHVFLQLLITKTNLVCIAKYSWIIFDNMANFDYFSNIHLGLRDIWGIWHFYKCFNQALWPWKHRFRHFICICSTISLEDMTILVIQHFLWWPSWIRAYMIDWTIS